MGCWELSVCHAEEQPVQTAGDERHQERGKMVVGGQGQDRLFTSETMEAVRELPALKQEGAAGYQNPRALRG